MPDTVPQTDPAGAAARLRAILDRLDAEAAAADVPSAPRASDGPGAAAVRCLGFELAGMACLVPLSAVAEVQRVPPITWLPNAPAWVLGAANLRGEIVSVVDLRTFLGLEPGGAGFGRRLVLFRSSALDVEAGFVVDRLLGLRNVDLAAATPPTADVAPHLARNLTGTCVVDDKLWLVIDPDRLLAADGVME